MDLGAAIKELRKVKNLSQGQLAQKTGLSQTSLSQIERGRKRASESSVKKICKALGVSESLLYISAAEREDVPAKKRTLYDQLFPAIKDLIIQIAK